MARSLGLNRVPTLDPKGEEEYPSYEYVRGLVRALNANFEILNTAYGGNRQDTNDLAELYRVTSASHTVSVGFTVALSLNNLPAGKWVIQAKGNVVNTNGNVQKDVRLRDNTNGVTLDTIQAYSLNPYRIPYHLMGVINTPDASVTVSVEDTAASSAGTMVNQNIVLWGYRVLELL